MELYSFRIDAAQFVRNGHRGLRPYLDAALRRVFAKIVHCLAWVVTLSATATASFGQEFSWSFPHGALELSVTINDGATDGCWTNSARVKGMVEAALREKGYFVSDFNWLAEKQPFQYTILVEVSSRRVQAPVQCFGNVDIRAVRSYQSESYKVAGAPGVELGNLVVGSYGQYFAGQSSANEIARSAAMRFVRKMPAKN